MQTFPEDTIAAMLAQEQRLWAQRIRDGLREAHRSLDGHEGGTESIDGEDYAVLVQALQRADEVLSAMRPTGH